MGKIFISYRRSDSEVVAHRVFDWLSEHFGPTSVFIDIDRIPYGVDFRKHISEQVQNARIVLVIIGETWVETLLRRASSSEDWLRHEIEAAFAEGKVVIPLLIDRAEMPTVEHLPLSVQQLAFLNAFRVSATKDFRHHMSELASHLADAHGVERRRLQQPEIEGFGTDDQRNASDRTSTALLTEPLIVHDHAKEIRERNRKVENKIAEFLLGKATETPNAFMYLLAQAAIGVLLVLGIIFFSLGAIALISDPSVREPKFLAIPGLGAASLVAAYCLRVILQRIL